MKNFLKLIWVFSLAFLCSCFKQNEGTKNTVLITNDTVIKNEHKKDEIKTNIDLKYEENNEDEFISNSLFQKWKGEYLLTQCNQLDGWERESTSFSELKLIAPDSCIFKSWLADERGNRYVKNDNYQEYIGGILATSDKDSIEFYTKRIVRGGNNSLSPLLSLTKSSNNYFIYSIITSPPNNGIIKMSIEKQKK